MSKIIKLAAENVKRLKAVNITPDGNLVIISGENGAGKSSVLDSIEYALAGKRSLPEQPVRTGAKKAKITVSLDGETPLTVTRTITAKGGGQLTITSPDGTTATSPQALLDKLCGRIGFDPLQFTRMDRRTQAETLRNLVGLDFSKLNQKAKRLYDQRTQVNRDAKAAEVQAEAITSDPDVPQQEVSATELVAEIRRREERNRGNRAEREKLEELQNQRDDCLSARQEAEKALEIAQKKLAQVMARIISVNSDHARHAVIVETLSDEDVSEAEQQLADAEKINAAVRANKERARHETVIESLKVQAETLTDQLRQIGDDKESQLAGAEWPVEGLGFDEDGVSFGGLPFDQASQAEQLRVSVAIGAALNPELRVLLVRDGSLLDEHSLALLAKLAEERDAQVWLERVGDKEPCAVVIEDGQVREEVATT